jgi:hypothetical protein
MKSDRNEQSMMDEFGTKVLITDIESDKYLEMSRKELKNKPEWPPKSDK